MNAPEKMTANEILAKHGPAGWLIRRLQRYALLGWGLFFMMLLVFIMTAIIKMLAPQPVVAVDESGHVLGVMEFLHPSARSDEEYKAAAKAFAQHFLSLNSETIFEDYAAAMNMMAPDLLAGTSKAIKEDNYLARVKEAKTRSWLEFNQADGVQIVERRGLNATVRMRGNIMVQGSTGQASKPFDVTLDMQAVARNTNNTAGIQVLNRRDN